MGKKAKFKLKNLYDLLGNASSEEDDSSAVSFESETYAEPKSAYDFADIVRHRCHIKSVLEQKILYVYRDESGRFESYTKEKFATLLLSTFSELEEKKKFNSHFAGEVFHFLLHDETLQIELKDFNRAPENFINVKNGVFDFMKWKLKPHSPKYLFDYTLQVEFPLKFKKPKKFLKVVKKCFPSREDRKLFLEILAYTLSNNTSAKVVWFFVGVANSGKSMLLNLILRMIGKQFVTSIPLDKLNEKFALGNALHCKANIVAEVSNLKLKEVKNLKMLTGGDFVNVERKFADPHYMSFHMHFLFASNHLPKLEESVQGDDGIISRFQFLGFYNSVDNSERISDLDKIIYEEEANDIFYLLMDSLRSFYKNGCNFTFTKNSQDLKEKFLHKTLNPIDIFISQCCRQTIDAKEATSDIFNAYKHFCEDNNYVISTKKELIERILALSSRPMKKKCRLNDKENPVSCILGLELLED